VNNRSQQNEVPRKTGKTLAEHSWPQTRVVLRVLLIFILVAITAWIIVKLTGVILLVVLSVFFAYLVSPLVDFLRRPITISGRERAIPRVVAIALAYLIIIGALVTGVLFLVPRVGTQFPEFAEQFRVYWRTLGVKIQEISDYLRLHRMPGPVLDAVNNVVGQIGHYVSDVLLPSMVAWLAYLPWLIIIPILSFFLLKDAESFRRSALQMLPRGRWRWRGDEFFQDVSSTLAAYTRAQLTACFFIGLVCALGFTILDLPSPLVLGLLAGIFEFVPLMGPLLIAILAAIVAALHGGVFSTLLVLVFLGVLRIVQDYVIYPRLIGHGIHLHPLAVILAILAGHELGGVAGIFLAIPVVAILTVSYRHWLEHRGSEGFADLLDPDANAEKTEGSLDSVEGLALVEEETASRPTTNTTPDDMARIRPDLTTGELKLPTD
jgi:predicted PurR-regulated permease PerM